MNSTHVSEFRPYHSPPPDHQYSPCNYPGCTVTHPPNEFFTENSDSKVRHRRCSLSKDEPTFDHVCHAQRERTEQERYCSACRGCKDSNPRDRRDSRSDPHRDIRTDIHRDTDTRRDIRIDIHTNANQNTNVVRSPQPSNCTPPNHFHPQHTPHKSFRSADNFQHSPKEHMHCECYCTKTTRFNTPPYHSPPKHTCYHHTDGLNNEKVPFYHERSNKYNYNYNVTNNSPKDVKSTNQVNNHDNRSQHSHSSHECCIINSRHSENTNSYRNYQFSPVAPHYNLSRAARATDIPETIPQAKSSRQNQINTNASIHCTNRSFPSNTQKYVDERSNYNNEPRVTSHNNDQQIHTKQSYPNGGTTDHQNIKPTPYQRFNTNNEYNTNIKQSNGSSEIPRTPTHKDPYTRNTHYTEHASYDNTHENQVQTNPPKSTQLTAQKPHANIIGTSYDNYINQNQNGGEPHFGVCGADCRECLSVTSPFLEDDHNPIYRIFYNTGAVVSDQHSRHVGGADPEAPQPRGRPRRALTKKEYNVLRQMYVSEKLRQSQLELFTDNNLINYNHYNATKLTDIFKNKTKPNPKRTPNKPNNTTYISSDEMDAITSVTAGQNIQHASTDTVHRPMGTEARRFEDGPPPLLAIPELQSTSNSSSNNNNSNNTNNIVNIPNMITNQPINCPPTLFQTSSSQIPQKQIINLSNSPPITNIKIPQVMTTFNKQHTAPFTKTSGAFTNLLNFSYNSPKISSIPSTNNELISNNDWRFPTNLGRNFIFDPVPKNDSRDPKDNISPDVNNIQPTELGIDVTPSTEVSSTQNKNLESSFTTSQNGNDFTLNTPELNMYPQFELTRNMSITSANINHTSSGFTPFSYPDIEYPAEIKEEDSNGVSCCQNLTVNIELLDIPQTILSKEEIKSESGFVLENSFHSISPVLSIRNLDNVNPIPERIPALTPLLEEGESSNDSSQNQILEEDNPPSDDNSIDFLDIPSPFYENYEAVTKFKAMETIDQSNLYANFDDDDVNGNNEFGCADEMNTDNGPTNYMDDDGRTIHQMNMYNNTDGENENNLNDYNEVEFYDELAYNEQSSDDVDMNHALHTDELDINNDQTDVDMYRNVHASELALRDDLTGGHVEMYEQSLLDAESIASFEREDSLEHLVDADDDDASDADSVYNPERMKAVPMKNAVPPGYIRMNDVYMQIDVMDDRLLQNPVVMLEKVQNRDYDYESPSTTNQGNPQSTFPYENLDDEFHHYRESNILSSDDEADYSLTKISSPLSSESNSDGFHDVPDVYQPVDDVDIRTGTFTDKTAEKRIADDYQCSICDAWFPDKARLIAHNALHSAALRRVVFDYGFKNDGDKNGTGNGLLAYDVIDKDPLKELDEILNDPNLIGKTEIEHVTESADIHRKRTCSDSRSQNDNDDSTSNSQTKQSCWYSHKKFGIKKRVVRLNKYTPIKEPKPDTESRHLASKLDAYRKRIGKDIENDKSNIFSDDCQIQWLCKTCGKSFKKKLRLRIHSLTHSQDENYHCYVCQQTFAEFNDLRNHTAIHTAE